MLEIIVVWNLCKKNAADAVIRGRTAGMAYAYSIVGWLLVEGLWVFIGAVLARVLGLPIKLVPLWVFAFLFALVASRLTRLIARRGPARM